MAINTDITIDVIINEEVVDTIGLSKTLDNYSIEEIASSGYCTMNHKLWVNGQTKTTDADYTVHKTIPVTLSGNTFPITVDKGSGEYNYPDGMYCAIVWLYSADKSPFDYIIQSSEADHYRIVTEWNAPRYVYYPADLQQSGHWTGKTHLSWFDSDIEGYVWNNGYNNNFQHLYYWSDDVATDIAEVQHIKPYLLFVNENGLYFFVQYDYSYQATFFYADTDTYASTTTLKDYTNNENIAFCVAVDTLGTPNILPVTGSSYGLINAEGNSTGGTYGVYFLTSASVISGHDGYFAYASEYAFYHKTDVFLDIAGNGLKFYTDKLYKPIISGGHVIGYTDDMTQESDLDNWNGTANHGGSPFPPAPPPSDEDNDDPIPTVGAPYSSGLARYYVTTAGSVILSHISQAMGVWNLKDSGKDLYKNIISCKLIKSPAPIPVSGSSPFTVYGVTLQYEGSDITLPLINDNPTASFGSYNIPRKFNDFRDYAPYTKVEIYLPYCGWTVLPSHVVGRSVSVTYYTDIIAATCKAVVYCGSNVVAEAAGVIGLDIPMVTENAGAKAEAVTMGLLAYGKAGLQTALGVGAAVATKGKAGVKQAVSGLGDVVSAYSQTAMAFNQNYTEINGKNGDGCCIAGISAIVIKITRPKYGSNSSPPYVPSEYAHSTGYVSMKSAKVSSFTGLLVADNVDTSGISGATDREKQLIKLYLESGIYVNHPN